MKNYSMNPLAQLVKGIFIFQPGQGCASELVTLMGTLNCEILNHTKSKMMIRTTLMNLQSIKKCWLANDSRAVSQSLNTFVSKIIIGGRA